MPPFVFVLVAQTVALGTVDRLAGEYRHAGGAEDRCSVQNAIERAVDLMLWPASEIARSRLREANPIPGRLTIERAGERVRISFDGRLRETALHANPIIVIGLAGDELRYRLEVGDGALVQRFDGEAGGRRLASLESPMCSPGRAVRIASRRREDRSRCLRRRLRNRAQT
jgi:hypothetical protein